MNSSRRPIGALLFAGLVVPLLWLAQSKMELPKPVSVPKPHLYSAKSIKFASIGYWPAVSDWMWIQILQLIGTRRQQPELKSNVASFYELATDLDPRFYEFYEYASSHFGFLLKDTDLAIHFLEKGVARIHPKWTHAYTLHLMLAYYYGHEKNDWPKAKENYLKASEIPGSPTYLQNMKQWLDQPGSEKQLARRVLIFLISGTQNEMLKQEYQKKLNEL